MANGSQLGTSYFTVEADTVGFEERLAAVEAKVREFAAEADAEAQKVSDSFEKAGDSADQMGNKVGRGSSKAKRGFSEFAESVQADVTKQVGVLTGLVGAVAAVVGAYAIFERVGNRVGEILFNNGKAFETTAEQVARLSAELGGVDARQSALQKRFQEPALRPFIDELGEIEPKLAELDAKLAARAERGTLAAIYDDAARAGRQFLSFLVDAGPVSDSLVDKTTALRDRRNEILAKLQEEERLQDKKAARADRLSEQASRDAEIQTRLNAALESEVAQIEQLEQAQLGRREAVLEADRKIFDELAQLSQGATDAQLRDIARVREARQRSSELRLEQIDREDQAKRQAERESEDALAESFQDRLNQIQREGLSQFEREAATIRDEIADLQEARAELSDPASIAVLESLLEALNGRIDKLSREAKEQSEQQSRDTIEGFRRVIDESAARFGLDQIFQQLAIVAQNTRPD